MAQKRDLITRIVRRIGKPRDGDIYLFDSTVLSDDDIETIKRHVAKTAHPRARVLFVTERTGLRKLSLRQLKNIVKQMEEYDDSDNESG